MMASSNLWIHVKRATVDEPDPTQHTDVQVILRVGSSVASSFKALSPDPQWDQDFLLAISDKNISSPDGALSVELHKPKFLFRTELLGATSIPLFSIRHSNKASEGFWSNLFVSDPTGNVRITKHQILLDIHFELPKDIPAEVAEALEQKLKLLDNVLEKEVEVIENQQQRILNGDLTPPEFLAHLPSFPFSEPSPTASTTSSFRSGSPRYDYMSSRRSPDKDDTSYGGRLPRADILESQDNPFANFDWIRDESVDNFMPNHSRGSSIGSLPPTSSPHHSFSHHQGGASASPMRGHHPQPTGKISITSLPDPRIMNKPHITVEDHSDGASAMTRVSSDGRAQIHRRSPAHSPSPRRRFPKMSPSHSRSSSVGSTRSMNDELSDLNMAVNQASAVNAKRRWKKAYDKQLPEIRKRMSMREKTFPGLSGDGAITLVELVDQLQVYKAMGKSLNSPSSKTSFSSMNTQYRTRSRSVIDVKKKMLIRKHYINEEVRMHVFKRTIAALIYPASEPDNHKFEMWSARKPTTCTECNALLWGLAKQGVKCSRCGLICHERCASLVSQDCFVHDQHSAISEKMQRIVVNHGNRFTLLRDAFNVANSEHLKLISDIKDKILHMAQNFSCEIHVRVIAAQGLLIPKGGDQRIHVSVAVGNQKIKTSTFIRMEDDKNPPNWNEEFNFMCYNYFEAIQIRVWNERDSAMARMAQKLTKEGDTFLGEKIIEVRRVGPPQEVWYKLDKRTARGSEVSGHIKLNISATVEGEELLTPFHEQYKRLHEQMFFHCHLNNLEKLISIPPKPPPSNGEDENRIKIVFLPHVAQEIIDEFALRYAIEPIFRMMVHFELLVNHHSLTSALTVMGNLLKNLKYQMFIHVAADHAVRAVGATVLMEEYMDASNFGRDNFSSLLEQLLSSLKLDLQQYREFYPSSEQQKLLELVDTCQLLGTVVEFQQQAMGILTSIKLEELICENMKECVKSTFDFIVQSNVPEDLPNNLHPGLSTAGKPFQFFYSTLQQMKSVIYEDRTVYAPLISKFCTVNLGDISAEEIWGLFSTLIEGLFSLEQNLQLFPPKEYIGLFFTVKGFYDSEIRTIPSRAGVIPEFPRWFAPCISRWLQQYQKDGIFFVDNAWEDDKNTFKFAPHENQKFSSSTFQTFFYLHQGYEFVQSLELEDEVVRMSQYEDFAKVIRSVVQHYVDKVSTHIPQYIGDLKTACMLLNNLHATRTNIQSLFSEMGGDKGAGPGAAKVLSEFQSGVLSKEFTSWCVFVARSLTSSVVGAIGKLQSELIKLKSSGGVERKEVKNVARPLMDTLTDNARVIAATCDLIITQKVMKEVWYICLESLHRMLLPMLKLEHDGVQTVTYDFPTHNYSSRQCSAFRMFLDILKDFFAPGGSDSGVKMSTIDRGIHQLKAVIALYEETTEMLITDFILEETSNLQNTDASCGEVYIEMVDTQSHPSTRELEGIIRVMSAMNLKGFERSTTLKPYIEINLVSPSMALVKSSVRHKWRFVTSPKASTSPNFNQNFPFTLPQWESSELQVVAKHHATFGKDRTIGVAVVPLASITKTPSMTLGLSNSLSLSDRCQAIVNVLCVRTYDEVAKDFVGMKLNAQRASQSEVEDGDRDSRESRLI